MIRGRWRRGLAAARARLASDRDRDRGASAVELAILAPTLIIVSLLIVQFAIWFDAQHAALAAAQQGDLVAREDAAVNQGGWTALAAERGHQLLPRPGHQRDLRRLPRRRSAGPPARSRSASRGS